MFCTLIDVVQRISNRLINVISEIFSNAYYFIDFVLYFVKYTLLKYTLFDDFKTIVVFITYKSYIIITTKNYIIITTKSYIIITTTENI